MTIKILSNSTINKIAAGEVIERPASVVKELVENAIDAGATKILISLERAGKNLISISDDGSGMSKEELELAIKRHATSKLDEDDLLNINSFGFRGEALPSIGAISKFKITSKKRNAENAYTLQIIGGEQQDCEISIGNDGTTIEVRDLFFATPARLKFLRTDRTEFNASMDIVRKIALSHPHIAFTLVHDGKEHIKVRRQENSFDQNLKNRIAELIGKEFIENSAEVNFLNQDIKIFGFTSLPTYNRASGEDQHLFINNRPVKDKILAIALKVAYQDFLSRDRYPISALFLQINPQLVDVNVHPAKTEVRFHDPNQIRSLLISTIKDALRTSSHRVSNSVATQAINYMNANLNSSTADVNSILREKPTIGVNFAIGSSNGARSSDYRDARPDYKAAFLSNPPAAQQDILIHTLPETKVVDVITEDASSINFPLGAAKAQLHNTYIISQTADSIVIVDQHAAHERLGYEKIKKQIECNGLIKQRILIPEIVELPDEARAEIINHYKSNLSELGLTVEKFGSKSIIVSELPSLVGDINVAQLMQDLADHLLDMGENIALSSLIEHVTETYACHYAIRSGRVLSSMEMNELLRQMENTPFSGQCNHGRPTYVELKLKDIEKLFGRS
jgi:DNA mismatch repair protein MutL